MLRGFQTTRLAHFHSPFREQRLLFVNPPKDPNEESPLENFESMQQGHSGSPDKIESLIGGTNLNLRDIAPELLIQDMKVDDMLDALSGSGALSDDIRRIAESIGVSSETDQPFEHAEKLANATPEQKKLCIEKLLTESDEETLIAVLKSMRSRTERHDELLAVAERDMQRIFFNNSNRQLVEKAMHAISRYESKFEEQPNLAEQIIQGSAPITAKNITSVLGIEGEYSDAEKQQMYATLQGIAQANRIRTSFGQKIETAENPESRREARTSFLQSIQESYSKLVEYTESRLRAKAKSVEAKRVELKKLFDNPETSSEEFLLKYGMSAESFGDLLDETSESLAWILRKFPATEENSTSERKNRSLPNDASYLHDLQAAVRTLDRMEQSLAVKNDKKIRGIEAKKADEDHREEAFRTIATEIQKLDLNSLQVSHSKVHRKILSMGKIFLAATTGTALSYEDRIVARTTPLHELQRIASAIKGLYDNRDLLENEDLGDEVNENPSDEELLSMKGRNEVIEGDLDTIRSEAREKLNTVLGEVLTGLDHPIAETLDLSGRLEQYAKSIEMDLQTGVQSAVERAEYNLKNLASCNQTLELIKTRDPDRIVRIENPEEYEKIAKSQSLGYFSYKEGRMYLNMTKIHARGKDPNEIIDHEVGHGIVAAFRRHGVFPNLLTSLYDNLAQETKEGSKFSDLLLLQAPAWDITIQNPERLTEEEKWTLMDELANRFGEWKRAGKPQASDTEAKLFSIFENRNLVSQPQVTEFTGGAHMSDHGDEDEAGDAKPKEDEKSFEDSEVEKIEKGILDGDAFLHAYPEYTEMLNAVPYDYANVKKEAKRLIKDFRSGSYAGNPHFIAELKVVREYLDAFAKKVASIDREKTDLTYEGKTGARGIWRIITEDIAWVSLYDIGAMVKDAGSDISRMWKRRGEAARNRLGRAITEAIPNDIPYAGRLKYEFERRDRESEEEEVGVWEKGLDKIDSHVLQHEMLPHVKNKDQLKGIIKLLAHRGRLDWDDDHGLWEKLEYYSGYRMPRKACKRNSMLRNQWLQKMIADIWRDKDLFEHWKAECDGAISSGSKHLNTYINDLSATGSLGKELRKLLFNWDKVINHKPISKEEEVNPHLYEGILNYAMRNGKMGMEDKFFYLIRGVQMGLLSVDRLREFPGEDFGILNSFPFIDFFGRNNNTKHEIDKWATMITEDDDPFSPGVRTTKFLMDVVAYDTAVKQRTNKALKGAQNIDHEDIPQLLTQVDYKGISNLVAVYSGNQWKISTQGMQNGYVGYNSFFKHLSIKARIGKPPISARDRQKVVEILSAYSLWDNMITGAGTKGATTIPSLSWNQINNEAPVSGGKTLTKEFRNNVNGFSLQLAEQLGITHVKCGAADVEIKDFIGFERRGEGDIARLKSKYPQKEKITDLIIDGSENFSQQLESRLEANPEVLTRLLKAAAARESSFIPENGDYTYDNMSKIWNENDSGSNAHADVHAGHH